MDYLTGKIGMPDRHGCVYCCSVILLQQLCKDQLHPITLVGAVAYWAAIGAQLGLVMFCQVLCKQRDSTNHTRRLEPAAAELSFDAIRVSPTDSCYDCAACVGLPSGLAPLQLLTNKQLKQAVDNLVTEDFQELGVKDRGAQIREIVDDIIQVV
jgi:hypothetical protein